MNAKPLKRWTCALVLIATAGCNHRPSADDLGQIVTTPPKVDQYEGPYLLPQLEAPPADEATDAETPGENPAPSQEIPPAP